MEEKFDIIYPDDRRFHLEEGVIIDKDGKLKHDKTLPYKYFAVLCKTGHVGNNMFLPKILAIKAYDGKAAAQIARFVGRVKHDRKDAIIFTSEIRVDQYAKISAINDNDIYMQAHNPAAQREIQESMKHRIMREPVSAEDGLTAETEFYGEGHCLQNYLVGRIPYNKRVHTLLVETYIEENKDLWQRARQEEPSVAPEFKEEVDRAILGLKDSPSETSKPKTQDDGQGQ